MKMGDADVTTGVLPRQALTTPPLGVKMGPDTPLGAPKVPEHQGAFGHVPCPQLGVQCLGSACPADTPPPPDEVGAP